MYFYLLIASLIAASAGFGEATDASAAKSAESATVQASVPAPAMAAAEASVSAAAAATAATAAATAASAAASAATVVTAVNAASAATSAAATATTAAMAATSAAATALQLVEKQMAARYQPEESSTILPLMLEKGLQIDIGSTTVMKTHAVTLKNFGKKPITFKEFSIGQPFSFDKNGCEGELAAGANCEISLKFDPKNRGSYLTALTTTVSSPYQQESWSVPVKGALINPAFLKIKGDFHFGENITGKKTEKKFTIYNEGDTKAESIEVALGSLTHFTLGKNECAATLDAGRNCVLTTVYEPKADGVHQDLIRIKYKTGTESLSLENQVSGVGLKSAKLLLTLPEAGKLGQKLLGLKVEFDWILSNVGDVVADKIEDGSVKSPFSYRKKGFPGDGGTCKKSIGPKESCRVSATFTPLFPGDAKQEFSLKYFDGKELQTVSANFSGDGLVPARIVVKETAPGVLQSALVTKSTDRKFHIKNDGQVEATDLSFAPNDFGQRFKLMTLMTAEEGELCVDKKALKPGETCEFAVSFKSEKGGDFEASLGIKFNDGLRPQVTKFPFRARALATAKIEFEDKTGLNFGKVNPNESKIMLLRVTNEGEHRAERLTVEGLGDGYSLKDKMDVESTTKMCEAGLDEGKTCVYPVEFKNKGGAPADNTVKLKYFDGLKDAEMSYVLKATSLKPAQLSLVEGEKFDFGETFTSSDTEKEIKIKNTGDLPGRDLISKLNVDQDKSPFTTTSNTCVEALDPGKVCSVKIKYSPTTIGDFSAKLHLSYADEHTGEKSGDIVISGKAKLSAKLAFDTEKIDFGNVVSGEEVEKTLTLRNDGASDALKLMMNFGAGSNGYSWKGGKYPGDGGNCGEQLESKANCKVVLIYKDTNGAKSSSSLILSFSDGVKTQRIEVAMGGNSVIPGKVAFDKSALDFGQRVIGAKALEVLTVKNSGGAEIDFLVDDTTISAPFTFVGGKFPGEGGDCAAKLAKDASCKITVDFKSTDENSYDGRLVMYFKDIVTPKTELALPLSGSIKQPAVLAVEGESDFGTVFIGDTKSINVELKNDGSFDAEIKLSSSDSQVKLDESCTKVKGKDRCTVSATFTPTMTKLLDAKVIVKYSNGVEGKELSLVLKGSGSKLARISLGKSVLDFGNVKTSDRKNKLVTLKNEGDVEATGIELSGIKDDVIGFESNFPGKAGNCTDALKPGAECVIDLSYAPTAAGQSEQNLEVRYNNGKELVIAPLMVRGLAEGAPSDPNRAIASEPGKAP